MALNLSAFDTKPKTISKLNLSAFGKAPAIAEPTPDIVLPKTPIVSPLSLVGTRTTTPQTQIRTRESFFAPSPEGVGFRDVIRGFPGALGRLGQEIARETATVVRRGEPLKPESRIQKILFGKDEFSAETIGREYAAIIGKEEDIDKKTAVFIGLFAGSLNFIGGFGKKAIKESAKVLKSLDNVTLVKNELKRVGIQGDQRSIDDLSEILARETDEKIIEKTLRIFSAPVPAKAVVPSKKIETKTPAITKELEPLAQEARKLIGETQQAVDNRIRFLGESVKNSRGWRELQDKIFVLSKEERSAVFEDLVGILQTNNLKTSGTVGVQIKRFFDNQNKIVELTDFFNQVKRTAVLPKTPVETQLPAKALSRDLSLEDTVPPPVKEHKVLTSEGRKLLDDEGNVVFPKDLERAPTPLEKPSFVGETAAVMREDKKVAAALESVSKKHGNTDVIIQSLEKKGVTAEELDGIILENGVRLVDTVKVKREKNGVLSAVITKKDMADMQSSFTLENITDKWIPTRTAMQKVREAGRTAKGAALEYYELPQLFFRRTGLSDHFYTPIREAERNAQNMKTAIFQQFEEAGLYKKGGWFTADRFDLSKAEAGEVARVYLIRQGKNTDRQANLSAKGREFIEIFDGVIAQSEDRFFKVAELNGKDPSKVPNYAPLMTNDEFKLAQNIGDMEFIFRKHPTFFSLKKRAEDVPFEMYELDYRRVAAKWIDQNANFVHLGEVGPQTKYLANSDEFKEVVGEEVFVTTNKWLQDTFSPQALSSGEKAARIARKPAAVAALGLNIASVVKQALTQIPLTIIEKAPPKLKSQFAKDFGIDVADLPSIKERRGNAAIMDMQEGFTKAVVGPLAQFDKKNAQVSLNALLDKNLSKFLKEGKEISVEVQAQIIKMSQDRLDMWYGGMTRAQLPRAFRTELGKILNMFIQPLTSQLNGFFFSVASAKGIKKAEKLAEVLAAAVSIAYLEQVIVNLDVNWSDTRQMTADVFASLAGNIPLISQIVFALRSDQPIQVSPAISNVFRVGSQITKATKDQASITDVGLAFMEMFGVPKQVRRTVQGVNLIMEEGLRDKNGKLLAPVTGTDEQIRAFLRGKYGTIATQDYIRNIGVVSEKRRWYVPEVEFLQNGDYKRKAELFNSFDARKQRELYAELSEGQQKRLDSELDKSVEVGIPEIELEIPEIELPEITI